MSIVHIITLYTCTQQHFQNGENTVKIQDFGVFSAKSDFQTWISDLGNLDFT